MKTFAQKLVLGVVAGLSLSAVQGKADSVQGTYSDGPGTLILEPRSSGKAEITDHGQSQDCTYNVNDKQLILDCKGDWGKTVFQIHDDESLTVTGPAFPLPALRKQKK